MDELDLLGRMRADTPELDPFAERRIRNRLLTAATDPTPGSGDRLRAAAGDDPTPGAPDRRRWVAGGGRRTTDRQWAGRSRTPVRVGVAAAAVAAVLATGIALAGLRSGDGTPIGSSAAAAEQLNRAADAALKAPPAVPPKPGQVLYRRELGGQPEAETGSGASAHLCASVHETWMPVDPAQRVIVRRTDGIVLRPGTGDPTAYAHDPRCRYGTFVADVGTGSADGFAGRKELAALPTDPRALYEHMRREAQGKGSSLDDETFVLLTDVARTASPYLTPALTAALYRAMAYVPGIELVGPGTDLLGRAATVVGRTEEVRGTRQEALFDPATGRMLGERRTVTDPDTAFDGESGLRRGATLWQSVISVSVVDRVRELPAG